MVFEKKWSPLPLPCPGVHSHCARIRTLAIIFFSVHLLSTHQAPTLSCRKISKKPKPGRFSFFFKSPPLTRTLELTLCCAESISVVLPPKFQNLIQKATFYFISPPIQCSLITFDPVLKI